MTSPLIGKMPYTSTEWRQCIIWTQHERGVVEVQADVIGAVAVHPETHGGTTCYQLWHVSHIPTGYVVAMRETETGARDIAERLAVVKGLNSPNLGRVRRLVAGVIGS